MNRNLKVGPLASDTSRSYTSSQAWIAQRQTKEKVNA